MAFVSDSFTEASGTPALTAHTGETGATWTKHTNSGAGTLVVPSAIDRCRVGTAGGAILYYASGTPATADYAVEAPFRVASLAVTDTLGVCGRMSTGTATYYSLQYSAVSASWVMSKWVAGVETILGVFLQILTVGSTYTIRLSMVGTALKGYVDGVERISATDVEVTAAGKIGLRAVNAATDSTGYHLDSIKANNAYSDGAASFEGTAVLAASGGRERPGAASFEGTAVLAASGGRERIGEVVFSATSLLNGTPNRIRDAAAEFAGISGLAATWTNYGIGKVSFVEAHRSHGSVSEGHSVAAQVVEDRTATGILS